MRNVNASLIQSKISYYPPSFDYGSRNSSYSTLFSSPRMKGLYHDDDGPTRPLTPEESTIINQILAIVNDEKALLKHINDKVKGNLLYRAIGIPSEEIFPEIYTKLKALNECRPVVVNKTHWKLRELNERINAQLDALENKGLIKKVDRNVDYFYKVTQEGHEALKAS